MNKRLQEAKKQHEKYLMKMGVHPTQLKQRRKPRSKLTLPYEGTAASYYGETRRAQDAITGDQNTGTNQSIMANLHKEPEHVRKEILRKAKLIDSTYNKGPVMYSPSEIKQYGVK